MNNIFIAADVILDLLTKREPYFSVTANLFSLVETKIITAFTTPVVLANIFYISAKLVNKKSASEYVRQLLSILRIAAVDEKIMLLAINSAFKDFEDSIQYYAAKSQNIEFLITRNKTDYPVRDIIVCTPDEYLRIYQRSSDN